MYSLEAHLNVYLASCVPGICPSKFSLLQQQATASYPFMVTSSHPGQSAQTKLMRNLKKPRECGMTPIHAGSTTADHG